MRRRCVRGKKSRKFESMTDKTALLAANSAYYQAFLARDNEAMAALWAPDGVSCVHPGWPPLIGRRAVLACYADIFRNPLQEPIARGRRRSSSRERRPRALHRNRWRRRAGRHQLVPPVRRPMAAAAPPGQPIAIPAREPPNRNAMH